MLLQYAVNSFLIGLAVIVHYQCLYRFTQLIPRLQFSDRFRVLAGVAAALCAHIVEVWLFGIAYYLMDGAEGWGGLTGAYDGSLLSSVYFSFTAFTTLGLGDILPEGDIRFLVGLESLTGFVLITWTASFLYMEMTKHWTNE